jgi:hypothetical protein
MRISSDCRRPAALALAGFFLLQAPAVHAQATPSSIDGGSAYEGELMLSPYAYHWHHSPEHRNVYLIGFERHRPDNWLWGVGLFSNSFGQPVAYAYYGHRWDGLFNQPRLYAKLTVGMMYGYVGEHKDKVPFNYGGFSPLVVPALGYYITPRDAVQIAPLGRAAVLFSYSRRF